MDIYEETADLMITSMTGQMAGLSRDEFVALFRAKFPVEAEFQLVVATFKAQAESQIAVAQAQLAPGHELAVAFCMNARTTTVH
jgi:hypothetical protein